MTPGAHNESERGKKAGADTPTHLIKNCNTTHDGRVSKDRLVMADGTRTHNFVLDGTGLLHVEGKKQLSTILGRS